MVLSNQTFLSFKNLNCPIIFHAEIVVDNAKISAEMKVYQPNPTIADFTNEEAPTISKRLSKPTTSMSSKGSLACRLRDCSHKSLS